MRIWGLFILRYINVGPLIRPIIITRASTERKLVIVMLLTVCSDDLLQSRGARLQHGKLYSYVCHSIYRRASGGLGILPPLVAVVIFGECSFEGNFPRAWNKQCSETPSGYAAASA